MVELKGITFQELLEKYGDPKEVRTQHKPGYFITFKVNKVIRIESKKSYYKRNGLPHVTCLEWKIIPFNRSKVLEKECQLLHDSFFINKTPAQLSSIITALKELENNVVN